MYSVMSVAVNYYTVALRTVWAPNISVHQVLIAWSAGRCNHIVVYESESSSQKPAVSCVPHENVPDQISQHSCSASQPQLIH